MTTQAAKKVRLFLMVSSTALVFGLSQDAAWGQGDPDLIANWTFDDESGEDFTGDHPLEYLGNIEIVPAILGNGVRFVEGGADLEDGSAARPSNDLPLDLATGDFTVSVWVNWNTLEGEQVILEKFTDAGGPGWTLTKLFDNSILFFFDADVIDVSLQSSAEEIEFQGEWYNIVVRSSGGDFELFVNGAVASAGQAVGTLHVSENPLLIGKRNEGSGQDFPINGRIDDLAFWERDLANGDVDALYGDGFGSEVAGNLELGLIAYYRFEDNVDDSSGVTGPLELAGDALYQSGQFGRALELIPAPPPAPQGYAVAIGDGIDSEFNFEDKDFSMSVWVNYDTDEGEQVMVEKFNGAAGPGWTLTKLQQGPNIYHFYIGGSINAEPIQTIDLVGNWNHIVVSRSDLMTTMYRNGEVIAFGEQGFIPNASEKLHIGRRNPADARGFFSKARFDDFTIWSRALEEDEVLDIYNAGEGKAACCLEPPLPRCGPPQNVALDNVGETEVRVTWSAPEPVVGVAVQGYEVFQTAPALEGDGKVHEGLIAGTELVVTGLQRATRHCYRVRCIGDNDLPSRLATERCERTGGTLELNEGLLGYWPFDDGGIDCSSALRHLEVSSNTDTDDGVLGDGLVVPFGETFDIAPAYRPENDPQLNFGSGDFTIQLWVNFADTLGEQVLLEKFLGGGGPAWTISKLDGDSILFFGGASVSGPAILTPGDWHHIVVRRTGNIAQIFLDNEPLAEGALGAIGSTDGPLIVGQRNQQDGRGFILDGTIDEIAIWNRELSDADIATLWNDGFASEIQECGVVTRPNSATNVQTVAGPNDVTVSWTAAAPANGVTVTGYNVYRTAPSQSKLNTDPINGTEFQVTDLPGSLEFCFMVRTVSDAALESADSNESCATTTAPPPVVTDGLQGYWNFDEDGVDCSPNGLDVELAADDVSVGIAEGLIGDGLSIVPGLLLEDAEAGPAYRPQDDPALDFGANDFTIQVWIKYNFVDGEQVLLEKFLNGGGPGWTLTKLASQELLFFASGGFGDIRAPGGFEADTWYQVVVRRIGSDADLFVNGVSLVTKGFGAASIEDTDGPLIFGMRNKPDGRGFVTDGILDEVAIWNRGLSEGDILGLYGDGFGSEVTTDCGGVICVPEQEICDDGVDNDCDTLVDGADTDDCPGNGVGPFLRGDCDGNGTFGGSPTEAIVLLNFSFRGGPAPPCLAACDAEANGSLGITDALRILRAAFLGVGNPDAPFPDCTLSEAASDADLGCENPFCSN